MHARNRAPETLEAGHSFQVPAMRPSTHLARGASRRVLIVALAAAALIAVSAAVLVRLGQDEGQTLANRPAPAEPGLFEFPSRRETPPTAAAPVAPAPQTEPATASAPPPRAASPAGVKPPALPTGVERFDSCRPACDSRDPALSGAPPAAAPPRVASDVPLPPRGIGEGVPARAEPGLIDRTVSATRTAVSDVTEQMKSVFGIK
ncbi:MAG: hypothetical protein B7Y70_10390 [Rhizobiales bacterium 35-68-8]|nr:MAG: hypothetical protein B7Y70_10390 [Rhizobiales bacterium 35-68-8]